jgi:hypothetical protein
VDGSHWYVAEFVCGGVEFVAVAKKNQEKLKLMHYHYSIK